MEIIIDHASSISKHIHFPTIDSTNTWAKLHSDAWSSYGLTLITADMQTEGRGRFKRLWISPQNVNIYATFCFWDASNLLSVGYIPQLLALAATKILEEQGFFCTLKWPNDVMLEGKKVAGILCEVISEGSKKGIVCGIGMNINMSPEQLEKIDRPATSLYAVSGNLYSVASLLKSLQNTFGSYLHYFFVHGFLPFFPEIVSRSFHSKGQQVRFHTNQKVVSGSFHSWESSGSVGIFVENEGVQYFHAGEFY